MSPRFGRGSHGDRPLYCDPAGPTGWEMFRPADLARDQSYFLFSTTQEQLDFLRFPLAQLDKDDIRKFASALGLSVADKPDSQDICFVPNGDYAAVIKRLRPDCSLPGEIVDEQGNVLGQHQGVLHYTIGQRRGLGIATGDPLFVVAIDADARRVMVGPRTAWHAILFNWKKSTGWAMTVKPIFACAFALQALLRRHVYALPGRVRKFCSPMQKKAYRRVRLAFSMAPMTIACWVVAG